MENEINMHLKNEMEPPALVRSFVDDDVPNCWIDCSTMFETQQHILHILNKSFDFKCYNKFSMAIFTFVAFNYYFDWQMEFILNCVLKNGLCFSHCFITAKIHLKTVRFNLIRIFMLLLSIIKQTNGTIFDRILCECIEKCLIFCGPKL